MADAAFLNRLRKNYRHLRKWADRRGLTAFRIYDRDLPEVPYVIEWFAGNAHVVEFARRGKTAAQSQDALRADVIAAVQEVLEISAEHVFTKTHEPKPWGRAQYEQAGKGGREIEVQENGLRFLVNLTDHLDTGLFMDHRDTRQRVRGEVKGKRFLNLFSYTGAFSVYAAAGGAVETTTVDLSNTYLDWAARNLELNGFRVGREHELVRSDVTRWLEQAGDAGARFDLIVLDPPSFSTSKKMTGSFNIQRDQGRLVGGALDLLSPGGTLYFSTNYRGFELEADRLPVRGEEITPRSLPEDFHDRKIHRAWRFTK